MQTVQTERRQTYLQTFTVPFECRHSCLPSKSEKTVTANVKVKNHCLKSQFCWRWEMTLN